MTSQWAIVYSTVYSGPDQRKHQSSASLASVRGIHWWLVNSPHKGPVTRKMFSFDDVIMWLYGYSVVVGPKWCVYIFRCSTTPDKLARYTCTVHDRPLITITAGIINEWRTENGRGDWQDVTSFAGQILGLCPSNERRRYFETTSLIGWAQA